MIDEVGNTGKSPEDTRSRLLAATRELLAKKGRRGTTTREIADLAGLNEATLFRHFGHKDALIEACTDRYCRAVGLQELLERLTGDVETDLHKIADVLSARMDEVRDLIIMSLAEEEAQPALTDVPWRTPFAIQRMVGDYMAQRVDAGELEGDPLLLARFFMGMIFSTVIGRKKFPNEQYSAREIIDFQINVFLNGVRKKK